MKIIILMGNSMLNKTDEMDFTQSQVHLSIIQKLDLIAHLLADIRRNTRQATGVNCANNSAYQENRGEKSNKSTPVV